MNNPFDYNEIDTEWFGKLSQTEKQLVVLKNEMLNGKIEFEQYEDAVGFELFMATQYGSTTKEESNNLYEKYVKALKQR